MREGVRSKGVLLVVLLFGLGTALAMAVSGQNDNDPSEVVGAVEKHAGQPVAGAQADQPQSEIHFDLAAIKRSMPDDNQAGGLFQSKSWYAPPLPPVAAATAAAVQTVPTLPFTYIGKMQDGNDVVLFLSGNGKNYTVKAGDVLDNSYRVDKIGDNEAVFTYLLMNTPQTLSFNSNAGRAPALSASASPVTMQPLPQPPYGQPR